MRIREYAAAFAGGLRDVYQLLFHKRNIIIVSERKVKHVPISGSLQCAIVVAAATGICWASYSTGSYYAAHSALKEQSLALRSVVGSKVNSSFSVLGEGDVMTPMATSKAALSSVDSTDLFARIADLENKLKESEESKKNFIEKVEQKTAKNIDSFESVIEQTGLDVSSLKSQVAAEKPAKKDFDRQGGPYVPDSVSDTSIRESAVISKLDELSVLRQIVDNLPVRKPIFGYQEMSSFGRRIDPFTGNLAFHAGLDMAGAVNSKIYATADGTVSFSGRLGAYGNMVEIDHGFKIATRYGHLSRILVEDGDPIKKGQVIGIQGSTGRSTGPHLHYEVRYNNQPMDPRNFLTAGRYVQQKS
ncbi:MAG: peptidoglycan DD-metalloendopeptidase family protein [Alphaproteobacteria bacterium]|nr:peptidoglycan DD-metalloendopeptidase family protein [Alphaproteobacteria bacterium]